MTVRSKLIGFQAVVIILLGAVIALISYDYYWRVHPMQREALASKARLCVGTLLSVADVSILAEDHEQLRRDLRLCDPSAKGDTDLRFVAVLNERGRVLASVGEVPDDLGSAPPPQQPALVERPEGFRAGVRLAIEGKELGSVWAEYSTERIAARRQLFAVYSTFGLLFALLSAVASVLFAYHLAEPLRRMIQFVHRVAKGELGAKLEVQASDELAVLADDLNRMSAELGRSRDQLLQSEKMAAFGQLAAGVAHEINNPSQFISTNIEQLGEHVRTLAELAASDGPSGDNGHSAQRLRLQRVAQEMREILDESAHGLSRIAGIVDNLRTFSHMGHRERRRFDLREAVEPALRMVRNEIQQRGLLLAEIPEGLDVIGNSSQLSQVFLNLLVNAAQALGEQAYQKNRIEARARVVEEEWIEVKISDTGKGIPAEHIDQIFEPFYTTKAKRKGTGLGLTISRQIVLDHGGEIRVHSDLGRGTTFTVRLPRAVGNVAGTVRGPSSGVIPLRRARLLIVDDEEDLLRSLRRHLGRRHDVQIAESGEQALTLLGESAPFDIVLCDLLMPEMTGMELYERACRAQPSLRDRFIFMSGNAFTEQSREFAERMHERILSKPFNIKQLERLLQALIVPQPAAAARR